MPIRPPDRRISKWDFKVNPDTIKEHFVNQKDLMHIYYTAAAEYFCDKEERTKTVLDSEGVVPSYYPMYYNFAREVGRKVYYVGLGGQALLREVNIAKTKWVSRGLDGDILDRILLEVFGITLPPT